jgi:glycosyltransferase involved in cell wall biosynthesis
MTSSHAGLAAPARPRIALDGYNLALESGTGVATYARNLSFALRDLGYSVDVLYGNRTSRWPRWDETKKDLDLLQEIAFFDSGMIPHSPLPRFAQAALRLIESIFGQTAIHTPITGNVISDTYKSRMPHFDNIWTISELFKTAFDHFDLHGMRMLARIPSAPQIMHWTYPLPIKVKGAKNIYTLHDLVPLRLPYTTLHNKRTYARMVRMLAKTADHIVTVSECSKRDIINLLGVSEDRVTNTYQSVEIPAKYAQKPEELVRNEIEGTVGIPYKNYFLFFGAIEPKKNIGRLIQAYLASGVDTQLVLVGKKAWKSEEEFKLLYDDHIRSLITRGDLAHGERTTVHRTVVQFDYAPFPLLVSIIRGAKAVLFPSLYEGFGLPVLEAMSLGTPVMTSNTSSIPEVVGDAAITVDPYDTHEMAMAIKALDTNAELRATLSAKGRKQAALYAPDIYHRRLKELYQRLAPSSVG